MENNHSAGQTHRGGKSRIELHPYRSLQFTSARSLQPSRSLFCRFSDIRPTIDHTSSVQEKYSSMETNALMRPGGGAFTEDACAECATECQDASCAIAKMTSQCTDQCVVVACSDPTHGEMSCHGAQRCDAACDDTADCSDCSGFEEFLQCCTDYHAYFSDPRSFTTQGANTSWDSSLDDMFCDCGQVRSDNLMYPNTPPARSDSFNSQDFVSPDILSSGSSVSSASPAFPPTSMQSNTNSYPTIPSTLSLPSPAMNTQPPMMTCMWGNCNASFTCLSDLVGHVNLQHLRLPSPTPMSTHPPEIQHPENASTDALSCLWGDCNLYPSPDCIPGPSTGNQFDAALSILASHLFQDHLGLPENIPFTHVVVPQSPSPPSFAATSGISIPTPPDSASTLSSDSPGSAVHECSATHVCNWRSCSQTFMSCDELTAHITSVHVGAGKAHYECFWDGCKRHGDQGFSSKQKICRHIQSHTGHRPFQCKVCKQNFSEAATLQQHMRRHTLEKPYLCDFPGCGKAFAITGALTIHKRTHNGQKPFKCTYCGRGFAESSNLSKHLRTHTGDRPYSCSEVGCGKAFARPDQLTRHMAVHRNKNGNVEMVILDERVDAEARTIFVFGSTT